MKTWSIILSIAIFLFCSAHSASAALNINIDEIMGDADPLTLSVSPINPQPNQPVFVKVSSTRVNLTTSKISWSVNGAIQPSYANNPTLTLQAGGTASIQTIQVVVTTLDKKTIQKSITISPASVDLVWEAQSSVPPFYKGKPLLPYQGTVVVQAIPQFSSDGSVTNPKNLMYTWENNGTKIRGEAGVGKDSLTYQLNGIVLRPITLSVTVSTLDGKITGTGSITIKPQAPLSLIYQNNPVYGVLYNSTLPSNFNLTDKQIVLNAEPYFYSSNFVDYKWSINGTTVSSQLNGNKQLLVRKPDGATGSSQVSLKSTDSSKVLQYSSTNLMINF